MFGGIGMPELIIILVIALIFFGPGKLPEIGSTIGKALRGFKKSIEEPEKKSEKLSEDKKIEDNKERMESSGLPDEWTCRLKNLNSTLKMPTIEGHLIYLEPFD